MNHTPVLLAEVLDSLSPKDSEVYVDGTFGAGGYSRAILEAAECTVVAIDRDPAVMEQASAFKKEYGERFVFIRGAFGDIENLLCEAGFSKVDGFVLDIGVSSMQLDQPERGFSFRHEAALDMRMDTRQGLTAADIVNNTEEKALADLIYKYGEERHSRRIARKIVQARPLNTTGELAELVRDVLGKSGKTDPATKTFQALRIAVNDELGQLESALESAKKILKPGGRLAVVSFHSLEDRIVKDFLIENSGQASKGSRYLPDIGAAKEIFFKLLSKKSIKPSECEIKKNSRARSARLRSAVRV